MEKILKILLVLSWMALIFNLSAIPVKSFPASTTSFEEIMAHIFLYGVLSLLIYSTIVSFKERSNLNWRLTFTVVVLTVVYGISDEYHQGNVLGRFVSFSDLFFDFLGAVIGILCYIYFYKKKPKLLLHICCAGCGAYISKLLKQNYHVILYFYNPNIFPQSEYNKRLEETKKIARGFNLKLIVGEYNHEKWLGLIKGHENDAEKGERCQICYRERLNETAKMAKAIGVQYLTTTMTISPHKDAEAVNKIGREIAAQYSTNPVRNSTGALNPAGVALKCKLPREQLGIISNGVKFLEQDFKKNDGFKKSTNLSKELGLYRQNYCGCEYSRYLKKL